MSKPTCLLIDDDPDDRELFAIALENVNSNMLCKMATDGMQALDKLRGGEIPTFIFLDLNMPLMSGKACLAEMKKMPELNHVPIIIYSTSSSDQDVEETRMLGAFDYITKPPSLKQLELNLAAIFEKVKNNLHGRNDQV